MKKWGIVLLVKFACKNLLKNMKIRDLFSKTNSPKNRKTKYLRENFYPETHCLETHEGSIQKGKHTAQEYKLRR